MTKKQEEQIDTQTPEIEGGSNTIVLGDHNVIQHPQALNYKVDDSALKVGRRPIGTRKINTTVDPKNMTPKEYTYYISHKFGFKINKGWDGIERYPHMPSWSEDPKQCIQTREEALELLGFTTSDEASDGIDKRKDPCRRSTNKKDIRLTKEERRLLKARRLEDRKDYIVYYACSSFGLCLLFGWALLIMYLNIG
ncbi:MAG: hypothetical protein GY793_04670 [Proteobacteria bacterium]|nr:hypothetical protein [Pseudomonadota bacterium]